MLVWIGKGGGSEVAAVGRAMMGSLGERSWSSSGVGYIKEGESKGVIHSSDVVANRRRSERNKAGDGCSGPPQRGWSQASQPQHKRVLCPERERGGASG